MFEFRKKFFPSFFDWTHLLNHQWTLGNGPRIQWTLGNGPRMVMVGPPQPSFTLAPRNHFSRGGPSPSSPPSRSGGPPPGGPRSLSRVSLASLLVEALTREGERPGGRAAKWRAPLAPGARRPQGSPSAQELPRRPWLRPLPRPRPLRPRGPRPSAAEGLRGCQGFLRQGLSGLRQT